MQVYLNTLFIYNNIHNKGLINNKSSYVIAIIGVRKILCQVQHIF